MSPAILTCRKMVFSYLNGYNYTNKDLNKIDSNATSTTLYFAQEPVPGVYSVNEENNRFLVAIKSNGEVDEERLFTRYSREDYPFNSALTHPVPLKNTILTLNHPSPIGAELQKQFSNGKYHKRIMEWATQIDIDGKADYAEAKREKEAFNNADELLAPPNCNFREERNSSLTSSVFMGSTFSEPNEAEKDPSICSTDIDECEPMRYDRRDTFDSVYPADWEDSDASITSAFSFRCGGGDEISLSPEWSHDELPFSVQQKEPLSITNFVEDNLTISDVSVSPSSATSIAPQRTNVRFSLQVHFSLPADEKPKEPHTTTFKPKPQKNKRKSNDCPNPSNNTKISAIDLPGYAFLAKPLEIAHSTIHNRWFLKSELDQRTLYRNMCAVYNCHCTDYCQRMELRRWKLLDDGYSWVPKDEQVLLVKTTIPQPPSRGFWARFCKSRKGKGEIQCTTPSEFRSQLEDSTEDQEEQVNTPNQSLYVEHRHLRSVERGDKIGTEGEVLFFLERGEEGSVRMRIMRDEEMVEARELQEERRGKFLVFVGNEDANSGLMKLARYLERGGEMVTFLCR